LHRWAGGDRRTGVVACPQSGSFRTPNARLLYGALAILVAVVLARVLKWVVLRLEQHHPGEERELVRLRRRSGFVEQFGLRTTVLRSLNGDRVYAPNSQIITAVRTSRGYRCYSIELLTHDPAEARRALESAARRAPTGEARFLRPPRVTEGTWLLRGRADVAPTLEWLAEVFLVEHLKARASDVLLADPIVYTLDEDALTRYERRVLVS
jgi:hypothetical protein